MISYLQILLGALLCALLTTPSIIRLAYRFRIVDVPGVRKVHSKSIPHLGGVAVLASAACPLLVMAFIPNAYSAAFHRVPIAVFALAATSLSVFMVGLIDDIKGLQARTKFIAQLLAAAVFCVWAGRIESIAFGRVFTLEFGWLSWPITILWIVGVTNAVNLSDGLDGLAAGICAVAIAIVAGLALHGGHMALGYLLVAVLGALLGFLFFNLNPARIFLGDAGSLLLGFVIGASSVICSAKSSTFVALALPGIALGVPIFDTLFSVMRRFMERRSLFAPDRNHFHHKLLEMGFHHRSAVLTIHIVTIVCTGLSLLMTITPDFAAATVFVCTVTLLFLVFHTVGSIRLRETFAAMQRRHAISRAKKQELRTFDDLQLRFREVADPSGMWMASCKAAEQFNFVWLSLTETNKDGDALTSVWRNSRYKPNPTDCIIIMKIAVPPSWQNGSHSLELAILKNGSFEAAARRASLFGRLLDEGNKNSVRTANQNLHLSSTAAKML
jgi:UDP-GlcNAc:undecaprenyl-phosphate/decaprenyl-phosphate GlcNAc-1-phosphate transferase